MLFMWFMTRFRHWKTNRYNPTSRGYSIKFTNDSLLILLPSRGKAFPCNIVKNPDNMIKTQRYSLKVSDAKLKFFDCIIRSNLD